MPLASEPPASSHQPRAAKPPPYRGRFAPSPTGPLHFGSLVAAVGSYLSARAASGAWLIRIEDIDPPREVPGSADSIVAILASFGFEWTESIVRQSERLDLYRAALGRLLSSGHAFPCSCTRSEIAAAQAGGSVDEPRYPGWCRDGVRNSQRPAAIRFRVSDESVAFNDGLQGPLSTNLAESVGDFVIQRRDGLIAYQLAVALDDAAQRITHVVRGADLLDSTPRQILVQRALGLATPVYAHLPLVTDANGIKLSKSAGAAAIDLRGPSEELWRALRFLRQAPPSELRRSALPTLWDWAIEHWRPERLCGLRHAPTDLA